MPSKLKMYEGLVNTWKDCTKCPLSERRTNVVFGKGNLDAKLVVIAEAPGIDEDLASLPFVGKPGEQFEKILNAVEIKQSDIWITNTCLCVPKTGKPEKETRAPLAKEIRQCLPRLIDEINIIRPEIIVLAGNTPLYMATSKRGITKNRGWQDMVWDGEGFRIEKIYATLHPASILHGSVEQIRQKRQWVWEDWQIISGALSGKKTEKT